MCHTLMMIMVDFLLSIQPHVDEHGCLVCFMFPVAPCWSTLNEYFCSVDACHGNCPGVDQHFQHFISIVVVRTGD
jgi:hypothetical protein